jgi:hypothetical protein
VFLIMFENQLKNSIFNLHDVVISMRIRGLGGLLPMSICTERRWVHRMKK